MTVAERLRQEKDFHDRQAAARSMAFSRGGNAFHVDEDAYLDHESWIRPAMESLGSVAGLRVLDYGCGHGMAAVVFARRGAHVTALDLSLGYLAEARNRAGANGVNVDLVHADGSQLPFAAQSFDRVWGNAILHHLDIEAAARDVKRILRPGGIAVFSEPWGGNPLLNWARQNLSYPGKARTAGELPLRPADLRQLQSVFPTLEVRAFQLLSMARRLVPRRRCPEFLDWCDQMLLARVPRLGQWCRYMVIVLRK